MVKVHAAYIHPRSSLWASVCGAQDGPISDDPRRINCVECRRIASERGIVL